MLRGDDEMVHPVVGQIVIQRSPHCNHNETTTPTTAFPFHVPESDDQSKSARRVPRDHPERVSTFLRPFVSMLRPLPLTHVIIQLAWCMLVYLWGTAVELQGWFALFLGFMSLLAWHEVVALLLYRSSAAVATLDWLLIFISCLLNLYRTLEPITRASTHARNPIIQAFIRLQI
jgi:hypothetical protein